MTVCEGFTVTFDDRMPIYRQIYNLFTRSFAGGLIKANERIPSIRDMAVQLKVNANTVQRVYQELERDGLIKSKRGTGYFFTEDESMVGKVSAKIAGEAIERFLEEMRAIGFSDEQILSELSHQIKGGNGNGTVKDKRD